MQYKRGSFIRNPDIIDGKFMGLNELPKVLKNVKDETYIIGHGYDERPDLLAHKLYGSVRYWWVFAQRNPDVLKDPIRDFKAGTKIMLPAEESISKI
jgi:hypothetical protein